MDDDGFAWGRGGRGTTGWALGGEAFAADQEDGLVGFAGVLGGIAFDVHGGPSVAEARAGGKRTRNILETTRNLMFGPCHC